MSITTALALPAVAMAQQVDGDITDPVSSSTIDNGAPGDVIITDTGSITLTGQAGVTAVTIDSDNNFDNEGEISIEDSDNAVGLRVTAGRTGDISHGGLITVFENYDRLDDDDDGDLDGPFAIGANRIGILLEAGGTHTGNLTTLGGSSIVVEGNQSTGIQLSSLLDGALTLDGTVSVVGDDARGVVVEQGVSGDILLSGSVIANGENAVAVDIDGDVGGALTVESTLQSTGFASTLASNYVSPASANENTLPVDERLDAEALLPNTAGMIVAGSVADGLLINGNIDTFISQEDIDDETKDTIEDFDENRGTGSITSFGAGPALLIAPGNSAGDLTFGTVTETVRDTLDDDGDEDTSEVLAVFDYDFGLINRGAIIADGQNIGFAAEAVRIESDVAGGRATIITGGIQNAGTIRASSFEADAAALSLGTGVQVTRLENEGIIDATTFTADEHSAIAVDIATGVDISSINNSGTISAESVGETGNATAIIDRGGQLTQITNNGSIIASLTATVQGADTGGEAVAIDLSAHGAGVDVALIQQRETPTEDVNGDDVIDNDDVRTPFLIGDVRFGAGNEIFDVLAGNVAGDIDFGIGNAAFTMNDADLDGDINVSSGTHTLSFTESEVEGVFRFTDSMGALSFNSNSSFIGRIESTNSVVDLQASDSTLRFNSFNQTNLSSLDVTGASELIFNINPNRPRDSVLVVSGNAQIADGVIVTPVLEAFSDETFTQTLITAGTIDFAGTLSEVGLSETPFIYNAALTVNEAAQSTLDLSFDLKTAEELGFDPNQTAAYSSLLDIFGSDDELGAAITSITTEQEFDQSFNLLVPQRTNASTQYLVSQSNASFGALGDRLDVLAYSQDKSRGVWIQENFAVLDRDEDSAGPGFNGDGLGFAVGLDRSLLGIDNVGVMVTYSSGTFEEETGGSNPVSTSQLGFGGYIQEEIGPVRLRAAGQVANVDFTSSREVSFGQLFYDIEGEWSGTSQAATVGASTELLAGPMYIRPQVNVDWFTLSQDGYTETGGDGLLDAEIGAVDTDQTSVSALITMGRGFEIGAGILYAEASGGYRSILSSTPFETTVGYLGTDQTYTVLAPEDPDGAALFGLSLASEGELISARFGYDLEVSDMGQTHYLGASLRLAF